MFQPAEGKYSFLLGGELFYGFEDEVIHFLVLVLLVRQEVFFQRVFSGLAGLHDLFTHRGDDLVASGYIEEIPEAFNGREFISLLPYFQKDVLCDLFCFGVGFCKGQGVREYPGMIESDNSTEGGFISGGYLR